MSGENHSSRRTKPKISICIPFYNKIHYLQRAVQSVIQQSVTSWELLIVDDCGPESEQAASYLLSLGDSRISYFRNTKNLGLAGNWNQCLALATGDYVTLLHADDELLPEYAETMIAALNDNPQAIAVCCPAEIIDHESQQVFSFPDFIKARITPKSTERYSVLQGGDSVAALLRGNFIVCPTLCYRRDKLPLEVFNSRYKMVLDLDLTMRFLLGQHQIIQMRDKYYRYRRHDSNQTVVLTSSLVRFEEEVSFYRSLRPQLAQLGWSQAIRTLENAWIIKLNLCYCLALDIAHAKFAAARAKFWFLIKLLRSNL